MLRLCSVKSVAKAPSEKREAASEIPSNQKYYGLYLQFTLVSSIDFLTGALVSSKVKSRPASTS
jgi:hypothetical protein